DVPFLDATDDQSFTFDPENAKAATAKGAVLALATQESNGVIRVEFDSDLANRLPFDVGYRDYTVNQPRRLFVEHTHYRDLAKALPCRVPMAVRAVDTAHARQFTLCRRFPGDDG